MEALTQQVSQARVSKCGIFSEKRPGLDCISIGPNLKDIHTIKERASISSIARVWEFIKELLALKE
jgi:dipeptidase D